ncbi:MAG: helix-turn-helix domain-containing protein [Sedimentisphaerales bacterium]|nr:helix-turn-helix domain-containing protein [Sedimentisphaerales bacterium]
MNSDYDFGVVRAIRKRAGLTLQQLAQASGLTYPTVEMIETNKTIPSLKTLDAVAGALGISTSNLLSLAEHRLVQRRKACPVSGDPMQKGLEGLDLCRVAFYDKAKMFRVRAVKDQPVHVMDLHEDCHEFCYVLSGVVELKVADMAYSLEADDTIFFDGMLDHTYSAIEDGEYITVHIPKNVRILETMLQEQGQE